VSLRQVLLVDDSQAILAYETAALSGLYALTTATSVGRRSSTSSDRGPRSSLLDLLHAGQDGDELLVVMQGRPDLKAIPS